MRASSFPKARDDKILRAAQIVADERICRAHLARAPRRDSRASAEELDARFSHAEIIGAPTRRELDDYVEAYWEQRRRKGMTGTPRRRLLRANVGFSA